MEEFLVFHHVNSWFISSHSCKTITCAHRSNRPRRVCFHLNPKFFRYSTREFCFAIMCWTTRSSLKNRGRKTNTWHYGYYGYLPSHPLDQSLPLRVTGSEHMWAGQVPWRTCWAALCLIVSGTRKITTLVARMLCCCLHQSGISIMSSGGLKLSMKQFE